MDSDNDGSDDCSDNCLAEDASPCGDPDGDGCLDGDGDGVDDCADLCLAEDASSCDGNGDGCLDDTDGDGVDDCIDNCLVDPNPGQLDGDGDGEGDDCDCGDGILNGPEECEDGNLSPGDGCDDTCRVEPGACCVDSVLPSTCMAAPPFQVDAGSGLNLAIPDNGFPANLACTPPVSLLCNGVTVQDLDVELGLIHTWVGDLTVQINGPLQTETVLNQSGVPAFSPFGYTSDLVASFPITFDDSAPTDAEDLGITFVPVACQDDGLCDYFPNPNPLANFNTTAVTGAWNVCVGDSENFDVGTIESLVFFFN